MSKLQCQTHVKRYCREELGGQISENNLAWRSSKSTRNNESE